MHEIKSSGCRKIISLLILLLLFNLPLVSALEISNVRAESVKDTNAVIAWETDEPADSFVSYGLNKEELKTIGDAKSLNSHALELAGLLPEQTYYFKVESNGVAEDNGGNFYSFITSALDTEAPELSVEIPLIVAGTKADISGISERGAKIEVKVNGQLAAGMVVEAEDGKFTFSEISLDGNKDNEITLEAKDDAGNVAVFSGKIFSDIIPPKITLEALPELIAESSLQLKGTVSEDSAIEIFIDGRSASKTEGKEIDVKVTLKEGSNAVRVVATDAAGWETAEEFTVEADTRPPQVRFEMVKGTEYYEGSSLTPTGGYKPRAETDITGETEAGANVYLYIFLRDVGERTLSFDRAIEKATADAEGKFTFKEVTFPPAPFSSLKQLKPKEVPEGLQELVVSPVSRLAEEQRKVYEVYVIAEDKTGKTAYAKRTVNVNSCYSGDFAFHIEPISEFQSPFRLKPNLLEEGRETIAAVFNISYRGGAIGRADPATGQVEAAYQVSNVQFLKACTRETSEEDDYYYGCRLLSRLVAQPNFDRTAYYVTGNLQRADEFIEREDKVWDDFVNKRQLKFPLKVLVNYQEREANGAWSERKTQVACQDLAYFVDVPIESEELIPDFIANEGVEALNWTINKIEEVKPYLETAMMVAGVSCVASFLTKMTTRLYRIFVSKAEPIWRNKKTSEDKFCPAGNEQSKLYLRSTIGDWKEAGVTNIPSDIDSRILDERCPQTANAWKAEAFLDQFYRETCDRFLCRSVPAGWTADKEEPEIKNVILEQQQCAATSTGIPLKKVENCEKWLEKNPAQEKLLVEIKKEKVSFPCYEDVEGVRYYAWDEQSKHPYISQGIWTLTPVGNVLEVGKYPKDDLLAYKPEGSDTFIVAVDQTCEKFCSRKPGFGAAKDGYSDKGVASSGGKKGCYKEVKESGKTKLLNQNNNPITGEGKYQAGYTSDCFIEQRSDGTTGATGNMYQCVCQRAETGVGTVSDSKDNFRRVAGKRDNSGKGEDWIYRQARLYEDSGSQLGTYYAKDRYYKSRDFWGAFSLDAGLENIPGFEKKTAKVNPKDYLGSVQTLCLTKVNANLNMLQSTLIGLQKCIMEAKYSKEMDAGFCKTLFTNYVCGLIYQGISYLASDCSPLNVKNVAADFSESNVGAYFKAGFSSIPEAMQSSIDEVNEDYGNAKFQEYFATGAQGFAESMCLAAFGYDFPMGMDFIQDAAYAASTNVDVLFPIAQRELRTFDPIKGKAVFDYKIGGMMWPGCKIRGYRTELKCIGAEDLGRPNVDCSKQNCDCLPVTGARPELEGERTHLVDGGSSFGNVAKGQMFDLPIPPTVSVTSNFRYDHVVFSVILDPFESAEQCFDEGYRTENGGIFYYPINDISPKGLINCNVHVETGRFVCPELRGFFGGGQTYFEHPFAMCYDKKSNEFVDCQTPNLFLLKENDEIVIKPYINLGNDKACLKIKHYEEDLIPAINLPENHNGPFSPRLSISTVKEEMIAGGRGTGTIRPDRQQSEQSCGGYNGQAEITIYPTSDKNVVQRDIVFQFSKNVDGTYTVEVHNLNGGVQVGNYQIANNRLQLDSKTDLTAAEIDAAVFYTTEGFVFTKIFGGDKAANGRCVYNVLPPLGSSQGSNIGLYPITLQLLIPGPNENCATATQILPTSALGRTTHTQTIRIQREEVEAVVALDLHDDFIKGAHTLVRSKARSIVDSTIDPNNANLRDAVALYYWIADLVAEGSGTTASQREIASLLELFFRRNYDTVKSAPEHQKIETYLCCVAENMNKDAASSVNTNFKCDEKPSCLVSPS